MRLLCLRAFKIVTAFLVLMILNSSDVMAAIPTYTGSGTFTNGAATITPPFPTGGAAPVANDICLLVVETENQAISLTSAQGFVEISAYSPQSAGTAATNPANRIAVYWKRAVGSDTAPTVADSGNHQTAQIHCFRGVTTSGDPWNTGAGGNDGGANDTSGVIPGSTTTVANTLVVLVQGTSNNNDSTTNCSSWTNSDLANLTERTDNASTIQLGGGHCMATGEKASAGSYGNTTVTMSVTTFKGAISLALKPPPTDSQTAYRWRWDDGSESAASWKELENANITNVSITDILRFRAEVESSVSLTVNARLEFSSNSTDCTDGTWTTLATSGTTWLIADSTHITNGNATTNQLTTSSKTFTAGKIYDTQNEDTGGVALNNTSSEWEWAIKGNSPSASTTYRFRVTDAGVALGGYSCGSLTTAASGSGVYNQPYFRFRAGDAAGLNADSDWAAAANTNVTMDAGRLFRIRFEIENSGGGGSSKTWKLQYRYRTSTGSWGAWADVPGRGVGGEDGPIQTEDSAQYVDEAAASTNLISGSSQTFDTGGTGQDENLTTDNPGQAEGRIVATAATISTEHAEYEFAMLVRGTYGGPVRIKDNDQLEFRMAESGGTLLTGVYNNPQITINMPDYFISAAVVESPGRIGPFKDTNGNLYFLVEPTFISGANNNEPAILKSTDGGRNWDFADASNHPGVNDLESADVFQNGDTLHICVQGGTGNNDVTYHTFRMSDHSTNPDTWGVKDETVTALTTAPTQQACNIVARSDGTIVVGYRTNLTSLQRVAYKVRSTAPSWGLEQVLDSTASINFVLSGMVKGESDKVHFFYRDENNNDIFWKRLTSADSLTTDGNRVLIENSAHTTASNWAAYPPVYWDDAGAEMVMLVYQASDSIMYSQVMNEESLVAGGRKQVSASGVVQISSGLSSEQPVGDLVVDSSNDKAYSFFVLTSDKDIYVDTSTNNGGWGTDTQIRTATNMEMVRGQLFTHSAGNGGAKVYGYWYEDGAGGDNGYSYYGEYTIPSSSPTFTQNKYRWYVDNNSTNPTDPWSAFTGINLSENTPITITPAQYDPPAVGGDGIGQELRLRINYVVATAALNSSSAYFKLQYRTGTDSDCSTGSWTDVDTGNAWVYATSGVTDGADITAVLSDSTGAAAQEYVKAKPSQVNHASASIADIIEYDFHIRPSTATTAERYLFRVVETNAAGSSETVFTAYTNCPALTTEPGPDNLMRHGNTFSGGVETGFFWVD